MSDESDAGPATAFWVIAGFALVWNLIGLFFYYSQVTMSPDMMASMSQAQRQFFLDMPTWATAAQAVAVTAGVLGSLLLLLRKSIAVPLFVLSLVGILVQNVNSWIVADGLAVFGPGGAVLPAIVVVIAIALVIYSNSAKASGLLS
ncbi:MAG: hypothetical protein QNJ07_12285 [Woeseiaceae bacterium]|nr:hypothetical protein [Woeseiaceae bacterium]